jgi:hypothetical protein
MNLSLHHQIAMLTKRGIVLEFTDKYLTITDRKPGGLGARSYDLIHEGKTIPEILEATLLQVEESFKTQREGKL